MRTFSQFMEMHKYGTRPSDSQVNRNDLLAQWQKINPNMAQWLASQGFVPDENDQQQATQVATGVTATTSLQQLNQMANKQSTNPIGTGQANANQLAQAKAGREAQQVKEKGLEPVPSEIPADQIAQNVQIALQGAHQYYRTRAGEIRPNPYYKKGGKYE